MHHSTVLSLHWILCGCVGPLFKNGSGQCDCMITDFHHLGLCTESVYSFNVCYFGPGIAVTRHRLHHCWTPNVLEHIWHSVRGCMSTIGDALLTLQQAWSRLYYELLQGKGHNPVMHLAFHHPFAFPPFFLLPYVPVVLCVCIVQVHWHFKGCWTDPLPPLRRIKIHHRFCELFLRTYVKRSPSLPLHWPWNSLFTSSQAIAHQRTADISVEDDSYLLVNVVWRPNPALLTV